jgi:hypothetical protein
MFLPNAMEFVKSHIKTMILDNDIIMNCITKLTHLGWLTLIENNNINNNNNTPTTLLRMNRQMLLSSVI